MKEIINSGKIGRLLSTTAVSVDGVRSEERVIQSSGIEPVGFFGALKGLSGAIKRLRGTGGF